MANLNNKKKSELHKGHRSRMREQAANGKLMSFNEHEILEYLLFNPIPRKDTNELAHILINRFGSLYNVLSAPLDELCSINGVGEKTAVFLKMTLDIIDKFGSQISKETVKMLDDICVEEYVNENFAAFNVDTMVVIILDNSANALCAESFPCNLDKDNIYDVVNSIMRIALNEYNYPVIILHCSNTKEPDKSDFEKLGIIFSSCLNMKVMNIIDFYCFRKGKIRGIVRRAL